MSRQAEKQARAEVMLGELAEVGLMVAKELAARLHACEDVEETVALADAFQKASRVVRLTLALDFKLDRDLAREAREAQKIEAETAAEDARAAAKVAAGVVQPRVPHPVEVRQDRVRGLVNRLLWNEAEGESEAYDILTEELSARLDEAARSPDFETLPIETLARRVLADMGISADLRLTICEKPAPSPPAPSPLVGEDIRRRPDG